MANPATGCRCGSGGHPRRCVIHPHTYDVHIAEMSFYDALHDDEPDGTFAEHVAEMRRLYAVLDTANRANLKHRSQDEDRLRAEVARLREADPNWGGETRRRLGVARGHLDAVADDLEEVGGWEETVEEIRQTLRETADPYPQDRAALEATKETT